MTRPISWVITTITQPWIICGQMEEMSITRPMSYAQICTKVNPSQYIRTYEAGARLLTLCSERLATSVQLVPQSQPCVV
jgi:hypothetical protein